MREYHSLNDIKFPWLDFVGNSDPHTKSRLLCVLPDYQGWWWNPQTQLMVRLHENPHSVPGIKYTNYGKTDDNQPCIYKITQRILKRAQPYALTNYAAPLFEQAIDRAEADVKEAYSKLNDTIDYGIDRCGYGYDEPYFDDETTEEDYEQAFYSELEDGYRPYRVIEYTRLRLHWLRATYKEVTRRKFSSRITKIDSLIKPDDVMDAADCFVAMAYRQNPPNDPDELQSEWYQSVLYACGATEQELKSILGNYPNWAAKMRKKRQNKINC